MGYGFHQLLKALTSFAARCTIVHNGSVIRMNSSEKGKQK